MKNVLLYGLLSLTALAVLAEPATAQRRDRPSSALNYSNSALATTPNDGYLVGADIWNTLKPMNSEEASRLGSPFLAQGLTNRMHFGSRNNWQEPTGNWPSGFPWSNSFRNSHFMFFPVFESTGWTGYAAGNPVRALDTSTDAAGTGGTSRFMFASFGANVPGANDANRNYRRPARYVDAARTHLVYEAGWPSTAGIDFRVRAHQFTPNHQNLNDFTVLEISLTNTGVVDVDGNGTVEMTNHVIDAVAMSLDATISPSIELSAAGDRGCNCIAAGRTFGYVAAPDATGSPYNMWAWFANVPPTQTANRTVPPAGQRAFGINNLNQLQGYTDIWNAWNFMGVKQGAISNQPLADLGAITASSPNAPTLFGTHPIGDGPRRGWYTSVQWQSALATLSNSQRVFRSATATWYADYGRTANGGSIPANLAPNPNFFSGGTPDDMTTWTVGNPNGRPNGDYKYANGSTAQGIAPDVPIANQELVQPVWEPAWNPTAASGDFYTGTQGFAREYTFGQTLTQGVGPYRLGVGESITIVWVAVAGFRFEGVEDAVESARWAWERGWNIDTALPVPAAPDMTVQSTTAGTALVSWTDVAGVAGRQVDGYKIWRAAQYRRQRYLDFGMRLHDRYQEQHAPGDIPPSLLDPINPIFDAQARFTGDIQGQYQPTEWGTYDLIATIPNSQLAQYATTGDYDFAYEDVDAITGFTYWYYVSAYRDGTFTGPQGTVGGGHIECGIL